MGAQLQEVGLYCALRHALCRSLVLEIPSCLPRPRMAFFPSNQNVGRQCATRPTSTNASCNMCGECLAQRLQAWSVSCTETLNPHCIGVDFLL